MSLLSSPSAIGGGVRFHADEDADQNMLQGKSGSVFFFPLARVLVRR